MNRPTAIGNRVGALFQSLLPHKKMLWARAEYGFFASQQPEESVSVIREQTIHNLSAHTD
jgi:hypothetical protein